MTGRQGWRRPALAVVALAVLAAAGAALWPRVRARLAPDPLAVGRDAYSRRDWKGAARAAADRIKAAPDDRAALRLLARSNARLGRDESAQRLFVRLGADTWEADDFFLMAAGFQRQKRSPLAWSSFLNALKLDPDHAEALDQAARIALDAGRAAQATDLAARLAARPGWEVRGNLLLATALEAQNDPERAAEALAKLDGRDREVAEAGTPPDVRKKRLAHDLLRCGSAALAERALPADADDPETAWLLSRARLQQGDAPGAASALARAGPYASADPLRPEPAPYVGSARCAECHGAIARSVAGSRHARTLGSDRAADLVRPAAAPVPDPTRPGFTHAVIRENGHATYEARGDGDLFRAVITYVLGSDDRGQTYVGRDEQGRFRELRLSRYAHGSVWDLTPGHNPNPAPTDELLGKVLAPDELRRCLGCHTTQVPPERTLRADPGWLDQGIGCEQCHGPAGNHMAAVTLDPSAAEPAINRPRLATAARVVALCGRCHGPPDPETPPTGLGSARFQASGLTQSRCYTESRGALSCLTCHDPHRDADHSAAFYEAKCLACHAPGNAPEPARVVRAAPCPVRPDRGCVGCHMPVQQGVPRHTSFSDHFIRPHRAPDRTSPSAAHP